MNIEEYAMDIGKTVEEVLEQMEKLSLLVDDEKRLLSDEEIILLDNAFQDEEDYVHEVDDELVRNM